MLAIMPERVSFAGTELQSVRAVAVSRTVNRGVSEYSELGPHCVFADVPEQRTKVTVIGSVGADDLAPPALASCGVLEVRVARAPGRMKRKEIRMLAMVTHVSYRATPGGAERTIELEALSIDGRADPVTVIELE